MSSSHVELLKQFVQMCKANPAILHQPQFAFYREYLESIDAKIPPATGGTGSESTGTKEKQSFEEHQEDEGEEEAKVEEPELEMPDIDNSGVLEDKTGDDEYPMGDPEKEVTEEDMDKAQEFRQTAQAAFADGDYEKSLENYTKAIECNPGLAILHAKRASTLLKMSKLLGAIKDCDKAISINPDAAAAYKFRGRAHRLLGDWVAAHRDLALSCKLDYDDQANEWLREVEPNAKKLQEYQRAKERLVDEKEQKARRDRVERARRAQEEQKKNAHSPNFSFSGEKGPGFNLPPELLEAIKTDPSLLGKFLEIMKDPSKMSKYLDDPVMMKLVGMMSGGAGGGEGMNFNFGGASADMNFDNEKQQEKNPPKKQPEPELD